MPAQKYADIRLRMWRGLPPYRFPASNDAEKTHAREFSFFPGANGRAWLFICNKFSLYRWALRDSILLRFGEKRFSPCQIRGEINFTPNDARIRNKH